MSSLPRISFLFVFEDGDELWVNGPTDSGEADVYVEVGEFVPVDQRREFVESAAYEATESILDALTVEVERLSNLSIDEYKEVCDE